MEKHTVTIENREEIAVTAVTGIDTFDEEEVCVQLTEGGLIIKGRNLHIQRLDLDAGEASLSGEISSLIYTKKSTEKKMLKKFLK